DVPEWIIDKAKRSKELTLDDNPIDILDVEKKGRKAKLYNEDKLSITWSISKYGKHTLRLSGLVKRMITPPQYSFDDIWKLLLGDDFKFWDSDNSKFLVSFNQLSEKERHTFKTTRVFNNPNLKGLGTFNEFNMDLDIAPSSQEEAEKWGNWLLIEDLSKFITEKGYREHVQEIKSKFPLFNISLLKQKDLVSKLNELATKNQRYRRKYWFVQTPLDLIV
ncbi:MAG: hypothetical protein ACTSQE_04970, partial [Candidatus Heimdallarchaeaceae archaeon]